MEKVAKEAVARKRIVQSTRCKEVRDSIDPLQRLQDASRHGDNDRDEDG